MEQFYNQQNSYMNSNKNLNQFNTQIFFLILAIISLCISINVIEGFKDLARNPYQAKHSQDELHDYAVFASTLTTLVVFYFLYLAYQNYKNNNNNSNSIYLFVAIVIAIATLIRLINLIHTPFGDETANEIV